jgi:TRAP-type C4-dicarboxylate transport system substrate-binding protein
MKKAASTLGIALSLMSVFATTSTQAQDKPVNLKISTWVPASFPVNPAIQAWADDIKKESGGTITSTLFPSEQLGKAFDHYDMARDGIADVAFVNPGYQPGRFPIFAAVALPFLLSDAISGSSAIDEWYRPYAAKEMKDVKMCVAFAQDPNTFHSVKKIVLPGDIRNMKVRPANGTVAQVITMLGGTNVQASIAEARDVLDRGVASAITIPWQSVVTFGIDKVTKYHLDVPFSTTAFVLVINQAKYNSMSPAQKKAIDDHCNAEWAAKVSAPYANFEHAGHATLAKLPGHEIVKLTPDQLAQWKTAVAPAEAQWADGVKKAGQDPKVVMDGLKHSIAKYKAGL